MKRNLSKSGLCLWRGVHELFASAPTRQALRCLLCWAILAALASASRPAPAQGRSTCGPNDYRILSRRYDAVLRTTWELRQSCSHPGWPARSVAVSGASSSLLPDPTPRLSDPMGEPLVRAGDEVLLWSQDSTARVELAGIAVEPARKGQRILVRISQQSEDWGTASRLVAGIVRGPADVEIEP